MFVRIIILGEVPGILVVLVFGWDTKINRHQEKFRDGGRVGRSPSNPFSSNLWFYGGEHWRLQPYNWQDPIYMHTCQELLGSGCLGRASASKSYMLRLVKWLFCIIRFLCHRSPGTPTAPGSLTETLFWPWTRSRRDTRHILEEACKAIPCSRSFFPHLLGWCQHGLTTRQFLHPGSWEVEVEGRGGDWRAGREQGQNGGLRK